MADIALGRRVGNIIRIALKIKEAARNAKQNEKECHDMRRCVARVTRIIDCFDQTLKRYDEVSPANIHKDNYMSMRDALEDLAKSLEGALHLVTKCQRRHFLRSTRARKDMANELRQVQDDIVRKLTLGSFAISVLQLGITVTMAQPVPPRPPPRRQSRYVEFQLATRRHSHCGFTGFEEPKQFEERLTHFNLSELVVATHNFSAENLIGRGSFAEVFKGVLCNGLAVALKKFNMFYCYDDDDRGLRNEIKIGGMLEHRNVVKTLGYCIHNKMVSVYHDGREIEVREPSRILVTEYLPKKSLRSNITREAQRVYWPFCFRIIQGIAQGLHYVHEQNVVHLDLKPDNIIFDSDKNPVIIDFGVSVVLDDNVDVVTTGLVGTLGYIAPECIDKGVVSNKCDVFAFGVILLRTIFQACAKLGFKDYYHLDEDSKWDAVLHEDVHKMKELFDPTLVQESHLTDVVRCLKVGLRCIEFDAANRPTMVEVVDILNGGR